MRSRLMDAWRRVEFPAWTAPAALLVAVVLCYALRLSKLGFFWDDWPYLYLYKIGGYPALYTSLGTDRPALSWLYTATLGLLGFNPLAWQVFAVLMRWLLGVAFWFVLRQTWPRESIAPFWTALLFSIYPGFTQQWISVVWGNAFVLYAMLFLSLGLTLWSLKSAGWAGKTISTVIALLLSAFVMLSTEYFFGLELLRPILIWLVLSEAGLSARRRLGRSILLWLPYLGLMSLYVAWRAFFQTSTHATLFLLRDLNTAPLPALGRMAGRVFQDMLLILPGAWGQALDVSALLTAGGLKLALFALACGILFALYLARGGKSDPTPGWAGGSILLGVFAFLAAGWPVWLAWLPLRLEFPWDRYTLPLSAGAALITTGLVAWLGRSRAARAVMLALLVGSAVGFHNLRAAEYRADWNNTRDLIWQLAWRAPAIQAGTALLVDDTGLIFSEDDSLSAVLNWIYAPGKVDVILMNIPERLKNLSYLEAGSPIQKGYPGAVFIGSTDRAVVLRTNPEGCLQVLDPARDELRPDLSPFSRRAIPLSRPELLLPAASEPAFPPAELLGPEPKRKWCYYYQQAARAVQNGDWAGAMRLKSDSFALGYKPVQSSDYLVLIEAALRTWAWDDAAEFSLAAVGGDGGLAPAVCRQWQVAAGWSEDSDSYRAALKQISCLE
jgi:hypothetical protein